MILKIVTWSIWLFCLFSNVAYIPGAKEAIEQEPANIDTGEWFTMVAIALGIVCIIEASITFALRHFVLVKPARKGSYNLNTVSGGVRFTVINTINWFIAVSFPVYGLVLTTMSGNISFLYGFSAAGIILLIFHAPRLKLH